MNLKKGFSEMFCRTFCRMHGGNEHPSVIECAIKLKGARFAECGFDSTKKTFQSGSAWANKVLCKEYSILFGQSHSLFLWSDGTEYCPSTTQSPLVHPCSPRKQQNSPCDNCVPITLTELCVMNDGFVPHWERMHLYILLRKNKQVKCPIFNGLDCMETIQT